MGTAWHQLRRSHVSATSLITKEASMKAVVMAGGEGSRLRPLTIRRPKPMVPIAGKPVMEHILNLLKRHGITEVIVTVQYLASNIEDYFGNGSQFGMRITYSREDVPLGTAGSVKNAEEQLTEPFLVISGDALTDYNLTDIIQYHQEKKALETWVSTCARMLTLCRVVQSLRSRQRTSAETSGARMGFRSTRMPSCLAPFTWHTIARSKRGALFTGQVPLATTPSSMSARR